MQNSVNLKTTAGISSGLGILIWSGLLCFKGFSSIWDLIKEIPTVTGYVGILSVVFAKWLWKIPVLQGWLVLVPNLNGTWQGELITNWTDPQTGQSPGPIKCLLVIRQTLFKVSCVLMTNESKSWSRATTIQSAPDGAMKIVEFTYSNSPRPTVQHRSKAHEGACYLEVITRPSMKLTGKYWTERGTSGEMNLSFFSKVHQESFG